jgi:hypothetical protein
MKPIHQDLGATRYATSGSGRCHLIGEGCGSGGYWRGAAMTLVVFQLARCKATPAELTGMGGPAMN